MDEMDYEMQHSEGPSSPPARRYLPVPQGQGCPRWRGANGGGLTSNPNPDVFSPNRHPHPVHPPYEAVHPTNSQWFPQQAPSFQWPTSMPPVSSAQQQPLHYQGVPLSDPYFGPGGNGNGPLGMNHGPALPSLSAPPNQQFPHDPFAPYSFIRQPPPFPPPPTQRLGPPPISVRQETERPRLMSISGARSAGSIFSANTPTTQGSTQIAQQNMPNSLDSSPSTPASRGAGAAPSPGSPRGPSRGVAYTASSTTVSPQRPVVLPNLGRLYSVPATEPSHAVPTTPPVPPNTERRRGGPPRARRSLSRAYSQQHSDYDSDDDFDGLDEEHHALRIIEQFAGTGIPVRAGDMDEERIRAHQVLRGQLSSKRVASRRAISSLQSVDISTLPESERMCVICYNEFGIPNPEGINELPLRLPKCKHVFGDHCIKKWFEESDNCPYCRDKLPSEPQFRGGSQALREILRSMGSRGGMGLPVTGAWPGSATYAALMRGEELMYYSSNRRTPPSETNENRRRTRPRHGSVVRGSPPSMTAGHSGAPGNQRPNSFAGISPSQQSPVRERAPAANPRPIPHSSRPPYHGVPYPAVPPFLDMEQAALRGQSGPPVQGLHPDYTPPPVVFNMGHHDQHYPLNAGGPPVEHVGGHFAGPPGLPAFSHLPHAQTTADGSGFPSLSSQANLQPVSNGEW